MGGHPQLTAPNDCRPRTAAPQPTTPSSRHTDADDQGHPLPLTGGNPPNLPTTSNGAVPPGRLGPPDGGSQAGQARSLNGAGPRGQAHKTAGYKPGGHRRKTGGTTRRPGGAPEKTAGAARKAGVYPPDTARAPDALPTESHRDPDAPTSTDPPTAPVALPPPQAGGAAGLLPPADPSRAAHAVPTAGPRRIADVPPAPGVLPTRDVLEGPDIRPTRDILRAPDVLPTRDVLHAPDVLPTRDAPGAPDILGSPDVLGAPDVLRSPDVLPKPSGIAASRSVAPAVVGAACVGASRPGGRGVRGGVDGGRFREVLGRFATGVVAITALDPGDGRPCGLAANSFTSVSLDPPLVAFCVAHTSTSWPRVRGAGTVTVNVLGEHQRAVCLRMASRGGDKFAGLGWTASPGGGPVLDGALAWMDCAVEAEHPAGDHVIVVARVLRLDTYAEGGPLLFFRGGYGRFAEPTGPT